MLLGAPMTAIASDFAGIHINNAASDIGTLGKTLTPYHDLGFGYIRLWDTFSNWRYVNAVQGSYDWHRLDQLVALHKAAGKKLIYNLACAPDWATGGSHGGSQYAPEVPPDNYWTQWVTDVVTRYAGTIDAWEIWNEPDGSTFYNGSTAQLAHLCALAYPIIKSIASSSIVLLPPISGNSHGDYLDQMLAAGCGDYCDAVSVHTYLNTRQPEQLIPFIEKLRSTFRLRGYSTKDFWSTEWGWQAYYDSSGNLVSTNTSADIMSDTMGAAYVSRGLLVHAATGVKRCFYYSMDGGYLMKPQILDANTPATVLPAGTAFQYVAGLLQGGAVGKISNAYPFFTVNGVTGGGKRFKAVWCSDFVTASYSLAGLGILSAKDATGATVDISGGSITASMAPVFLFQN